MSSPVDLKVEQLRGPPGRDVADTVDGVVSPAIELNRFLADVQHRAFRVAQLAVRDRDDALDIVQGAMLRLARSYAGRPAEEWKPIFYRILYNGIHDFRRRRSTRSRILGLFGDWRGTDDDDAGDPLERVADLAPGPERRAITGEAMQRLEVALGELPARQQQAFVLRCLEQLDVAQAAEAMGCSEGSVKTHYFRALQVLRARMGEVW